MTKRSPARCSAAGRSGAARALARERDLVVLVVQVGAEMRAAPADERGDAEALAVVELAVVDEHPAAEGALVGRSAAESSRRRTSTSPAGIVTPRETMNGYAQPFLLVREAEAEAVLRVQVEVRRPAGSRSGFARCRRRDTRCARRSSPRRCVRIARPRGRHVWPTSKLTFVDARAAHEAQRRIEVLARCACSPTSPRNPVLLGSCTPTPNAVSSPPARFALSDCWNHASPSSACRR